MDSYKKALAAMAILASLTPSSMAQSGSGKTTRYWDCCKPSCAWSTGSLTSPVKVCDVNDQPLAGGESAPSGCTGGTAYTCSSQTPWAISDTLAYGFAAVSASAPNCCACYKLTFTSTVISGKTMIVQATNTGTDVGSTQFDLAIPGGGFGIYDACTSEWKATSAVWGAQYGGSSTNTCSQFPTALQPGCSFRWDWMQGADNPTVDYESVACPADIIAKSGCSVAGSAPAPGGPAPSSSAAGPPPSSSAASPPPSSSAASPPSSSSAAGPYSSSSSYIEPPPPASSSVAGAGASDSSTFATVKAPASSSTSAVSDAGTYSPSKISTTVAAAGASSTAAGGEEEQSECEL